MCFHHKFTIEFENFFELKKQLILASEGCTLVELLAGSTDHDKGSCVYFTRSIWNSEKDLNRYRSSELFRETWSVTKKMFADKPEAWTVELRWSGQKN